MIMPTSTICSGFSQRKLGDYENGLKNYLKALELDPNHKGAHEYLGQLYVETGKMEKAREHLVILERLCPKGCEERSDLSKAIVAADKKEIRAITFCTLTTGLMARFFLSL